MSTSPTARTLVRPRLRLVGGVCAGFAEHTGMPVSLVRAATVALAACGGAGVLLYAWLWATAPPEQPPTARAARAARAARDAETPQIVVPAALEEHFGASHEAGGRGAGHAAGALEAARRRPLTEILLGFALLLAGGALVLSRAGAQVPLAVVIPGIVVLAGVGLAWRQFADIRSGDASSGMLVRALAALVFVALGILLYFVTGENPNVWTVAAAAAAVLLGVGLVVAPWAIRLVRDLTAERAARAREAERADIAAHLHDSVLQTLALIQQKAGPQSDAARLARAQERDLREWLFTGAASAPGNLADDLRAVAAALEAEHPVRFDVVTAGEAPRAVPEALLAAAREAMLNAARHAGGDVSVYLESSPVAVEVIVTDRGPGFDPDAAASDRFGVRESILGRTQRAGGSARIAPGPGGRGTSVTLRLEKQEASHD